MRLCNGVGDLNRKSSWGGVDDVAYATSTRTLQPGAGNRRRGRKVERQRKVNVASRAGEGVSLNFTRDRYRKKREMWKEGKASGPKENGLDLKKLVASEAMDRRDSFTGLLRRARRKKDDKAGCVV